MPKQITLQHNRAMKRRSFIGSIIALSTAPAIVRADSLMRVVPISTTVVSPFGLKTMEEYWKRKYAEAFEFLHHDTSDIIYDLTPQESIFFSRRTS